ncbi:DUF5955 family protein [Streptomyces sp. DSM 44915]|uniref:DUF5955 family protein n=1 Tax=Streptomyces chisholmiae TaxID=3075540 RepID=A0ABU2JMX7_9ACTN|nr:DUF5955 family protein [Streptomyces sp. DSM 44915]MDT0266340.1 DUF5955 family protein [Streptomyces sp. DSM 44915]
MAGEAERTHAVRGVPMGALDPRVTTLRAAVHRLHRELGGYRLALDDREVAERQLALLDELTVTGAPDEATLGQSLLVIAAALGSVSALAGAVAEFRRAVELFGVPHFRAPGPAGLTVPSAGAVGWRRFPG